MKKSDIKPGMAVELRNGYKCLVAPFVNDKGKEDMAFVRAICERYAVAEVVSNLGSGLKLVKNREEKPDGYDDFDVMKVYGTFEETVCIHNILNIPKGRKLLWERQEAQEMTLAEIETALGHPVKIVK